MHLASLLEMVESGFDDRELLGDPSGRVTGSELGRLARRGAATVAGRSAVVYAGENHPLLPVALFAAAWAGVPFVPVNYRLEDHQLNGLVARQPDALVLADAATAERLDADAVVFDDWLTSLQTNAQAQPQADADAQGQPDNESGADDADAPAANATPPDDEDAVAVVLYTSGTTSEPKAALLRHRHLMAYLLGSVEFGGADDTEAVLVSVPPYHVAGIANMLSNTFAGRRLVYMRAFDPERWLQVVREEGITNAMVVPTMLARIVAAVDGRDTDKSPCPSLRLLSYGGAKVSERVLREALRLFPDTGFVNAYGLTETASTIAVLGPDDHRAAVTSEDPGVQRRLASAGQVLPMVEIEVRDDDDRPLPPGETGAIFVRGEQIAGEYSSGSVLDADGWFATRDRGSVDADGYLFIEGRADDTIIRGGENIAPAEIEDVLLAQPDVVEACVVGVPDEEWGQSIAAAVVLREGSSVSPEDLRSVVRAALRGSKTPDRIEIREHLPHTETGKLLRRVVRDELS